jgi:hypothetical protein
MGYVIQNLEIFQGLPSFAYVFMHCVDFTQCFLLKANYPSRIHHLLLLPHFFDDVLILGNTLHVFLPHHVDLFEQRLPLFTVRLLLAVLNTIKQAIFCVSLESWGQNPSVELITVGNVSPVGTNSHECDVEECPVVHLGGFHRIKFDLLNIVLGEAILIDFDGAQLTVDVPQVTQPQDPSSHEETS